MAARISSKDSGRRLIPSLELTRLRVIARRDEVGENAADDPDAAPAEARVGFGGAGDTAEPGDGFWMVRRSVQQLSRDP